MNSSGSWRTYWPDRPLRARIGALVLALILAWQIPFPAIAQAPECGSYAVAVAPQPVGHPLTDFEIRLIDPTGETARVPFDQPGDVTPSPRPGVALLRSLGGIHALLDTTSGAVLPVQIPADQQPLIRPSTPRIRNAPVSDFMLLAGDSGSIWLVDLTSGEAVDLAESLPDLTQVDSASISPDGSSLLVFGGDTGILISLETPGAPIPIASEPILPFPGFSDDSRSIFYATPDGDGGATIRSLDLATGARTDLGIAQDVATFETNPGGPALAFDVHTLRALQPGATVTTPIFSWSGTLAGLYFDTGGRHLLIGDEVDALTHWYWIDTQTGDSQPLPDLDRLLPLASGPAQDSMLFLPSAASGPGTSGTPYRALDLTTGTVTTVLTQDSSEVWEAMAGGDSSGRYALINAVSPGSGRMWLVDTAAGTAAQIGTSSGNVSARVSPDGCQVATDIFDTIGEGRTSAVTVTSLIDGSTVVTAPDSLLLGWAQIGKAE